MIPVEVAFEPEVLESVAFIVINAIIDVCFAIDIFVVFRTTYVDPYDGKEVLDGKQIAKNYLAGRFWIDLLATIPFDTIGMLIFKDSAEGLQLFGILKLIRILRLSKIIAYMELKEDYKLFLKLVKLIFFLIMYLHLVGCTWYFIVDVSKEWIPPLDYVYVTSTFFEQDVNYRYWMSAYHSVLILTGNDVGPRNDTTATVFCAVFVTMGAIVNAYIFGELVVLVAVMNTKTASFVKKLDTCYTAMKNQGIPREIQQEVVCYLTYTQSLLDLQQELEDFLNLISPSLREKVIKHIFSECIKENDIFKDNEVLIDNLTRKLYTKTYVPEELIVNQGDEGDNIYFIGQGGCHVMIRNRNNITTRVRTLVPGDLFGEVAILNGCRRTATVKANNYSTIAHLDKDTFITIFMKFPEALQKLKDGRKEYQDEWKIFLKDNLRYIDYIKNLSDETVESLTYCLKEEMYDAGSFVFKAGAPVDKLYFIASGEVDIIVKIGKKEATLDTLYQACNIGEYGVLGDYKHTFTAKVKANGTHLVYIPKESLHIIKNQFEDLYKEIGECYDYLENSGLPLVDFRLFRPDDGRKRWKDILKLAIARVMRINMALEANYSPEEITEILQKIQIHVSGTGDDDDSLQKNSNRMLQEVLGRLTNMAQENQELKLTVAKLEKKLSKIEKNISHVKSEITGNPNTYLSSDHSD